MIALTTLWHYLRTRRLQFADRAALLAHQDRQLRRYARRVLARSPYIARCAEIPFADWPTMDKALMMQHFDAINTAGLKRDALLAVARRSEAERDFTPRAGRYSVGLSSGTSGQRGLFVVSPREQAAWAGVHGVVSLHLAKAHDAWVDWRPLKKTVALVVDAFTRGVAKEG